MEDEAGRRQAGPDEVEKQVQMGPERQELDRSRDAREDAA